MSTAYVPDEDSLLRYVKPTLVMRDEGVAYGIWPQAFSLRPDEEDGLSCAWVEFYEGEPDRQVSAAISVFKSVLKVPKSAVFVQGDVVDIRSACGLHGNKVRVSHEPEPGHDAHALVRQFQDFKQPLLALLASTAWAKLHPAN